MKEAIYVMQLCAPSFYGMLAGIVLAWPDMPTWFHATSILFAGLGGSYAGKFLKVRGEP